MNHIYLTNGLQMVQNGDHKCGRKSEEVMDEKTISEDDVVYSKVYIGSG